MNEMPTPETDALDHELHSPRVLQDRYSEMRDHARKMERERDEAVADRDIARLSALESDKAHDRMVGELEKVYKERDEAREQLAAAKHFLEKYIAERDAARGERDENRFLLKTALCALDEIDLAAGKFVNSK